MVRFPVLLTVCVAVQELSDKMLTVFHSENIDSLKLSLFAGMWPTWVPVTAAKVAQAS